MNEPPDIKKVVFTNIEEQPEAGEIEDITFYKSPGLNNLENIQKKMSPGTLRIAYVYDWENNNYEDSQWF